MVKSVRREEEEDEEELHSFTLPSVRGVFGWGEGQQRGKEKGAGWRRAEGWREGEGPAWLLSASHVSKPVLKNE